MSTTAHPVPEHGDYIMSRTTNLAFLAGTGLIFLGLVLVAAAIVAFPRLGPHHGRFMITENSLVLDTATGDIYSLYSDKEQTPSGKRYFYRRADGILNNYPLRLDNPWKEQ